MQMQGEQKFLSFSHRRWKKKTKKKKRLYNNLNFEFPTNSFSVAHFQKANPFLIT